MFNHASKDPGKRRPTAQIAVTGAAVFIALGGTATAARSLIQAGDIAAGAVTSKTINNGAVKPWDLNPLTRETLAGDVGKTGATGDSGITGKTGSTGLTGLTGTAGDDGDHGTAGLDGTSGIDGDAGADGTDGANGIAGVNGIDGTDGADGIIAPLSAKSGAKNLLTATPPTTVVEMTVPAGDYVVLAKSQISHTGAGDSVDCSLKAGSAIIDQVAMKTMPALAAIPMSMQAVTSTSPTHLSVECDVLTAGGTATHNSLIAIPIG